MDENKPKAPRGRRSVADEAVRFAEAKPGPPAVVIAPATLVGVAPETIQAGTDLHPALDPGPAVTSTATQNAREMNVPADTPGVPFSGEELAVTPPTSTRSAPTAFSGAQLLTTGEEAARRMHQEAEVSQEA